MFRFVSIAWKDIYRQAFKTILFTSIIATCLTALIIVINLDKTISNGINETVINSINSRQIQVEIYNSNNKSYGEYLKFLKRNENIEDVFRYTYPVFAQVKENDILFKGTYSLVSGKEEYFPKVIQGNNIESSDKNVAIVPKKLYLSNFNNKQSEPILGETLIGETLIFEYKDKKKGTMETYECEVVGIYDNNFSENTISVYIPYSDMVKICESVGQYSSNESYLFNVIVDDKENVQSVVNKLSSKENVEVDYDEHSTNNIDSKYIIIEKLTKYSVVLIGILLTIILYICINNIAVNNKKQVAIYKSLGYTNKHIFNIVLIEGGIISFIGYAESIVISLLMENLLIKSIFMEQLGINIIRSSITYIGGLILIMIIVFIVSISLFLKIKDIYPSLLLKES